jgi:hypothetical protein
LILYTILLGQSDLAKEQLDNQQNAEAQRERYYATIHKAALQPGDKIPGKIKLTFLQTDSRSIVDIEIPNSHLTNSSNNCKI